MYFVHHCSPPLWIGLFLSPYTNQSRAVITTWLKKAWVKGKKGIFPYLALNGGGRIFHSPSSLIFPACSPVLSDLLRDSHCTALQTEKLWIWSTGPWTLLTPSFRQENWVPGNLPVRTERSQLGIRWTRGRGGESYVLRLLPWRTLKTSTYSEPW